MIYVPLLIGKGICMYNYKCCESVGKEEYSDNSNKKIKKRKNNKNKTK